MVAKAHGLGLRAGWYMGNYQCADGWPKGADMQALAKGSVDAIARYGFDSVKLDSGFPVAANLSLWSQLLNESGRPVMIENCHREWALILLLTLRVPLSLRCPSVQRVRRGRA